MTTGKDLPGQIQFPESCPYYKGMSITMFLKDFGTEEKCAEALAKLRWPSGFKCLSCGCAMHCRLEHRDMR